MHIYPASEKGKLSIPFILDKEYMQEGLKKAISP